MSKRTVFTTITPLGIMPREIVLEAIHDHFLMIDLNPLVEDRRKIDPPKNASADEYHCKWYQITDKITYIPGGIAKGKVSYNACFHDLDNGLQTHVFAPLGLEIRSKWLVGGSLPGEPLENSELGLDIPKEGLYLREDVDMKCNIMMVGFVKKNLKRSHETLKKRLVERAHNDNRKIHNDRLSLLNGSQVSLGTTTSGPTSPISRNPSTISAGSQQQQQPVGGLTPQQQQQLQYLQSLQAQSQQQQFSQGVPYNPTGSPFGLQQFPQGPYSPPPPGQHDPRLSTISGHDPRLSTISATSSQGSNPLSPQFPGAGQPYGIDPAYQSMNPYAYPGGVPPQQVPGQHVPYPYTPQYPAVGPGGQVPLVYPPGHPYAGLPVIRMELPGDYGYNQDQKGVDQKGQAGVPQRTGTPGQQPPQQQQPQQHGPAELA